MKIKLGDLIRYHQPQVWYAMNYFCVKGRFPKVVA